MNTRTIADLLGWYASERTSIISRFPLIDPSGGNGVYVYATGGGFPTSSYKDANYWVDVRFKPTP